MAIEKSCSARQQPSEWGLVLIAIGSSLNNLYAQIPQKVFLTLSYDFLVQQSI
jgi:hypothetical protein